MTTHQHPPPTDEQMAALLRDALENLCTIMTRCYSMGIMLDFGLAKSASEIYHVSQFKVSRIIKAEEKPFEPFGNIGKH